MYINIFIYNMYINIFIQNMYINIFIYNMYINIFIYNMYIKEVTPSVLRNLDCKTRQCCMKEKYVLRVVIHRRC